MEYPTITKLNELRDFDSFIRPTGEYGVWECGEIYLCEKCGSPVALNVVGLHGNWRQVFAYASQYKHGRLTYLKAEDKPSEDGGYCEKLQMATCGDCWVPGEE